MGQRNLERAGKRRAKQRPEAALSWERARGRAPARAAPRGAARRLPRV